MYMNTETDANPEWQSSAHPQKVTVSEVIFFLEVGMEAKLLRPKRPSKKHSTLENVELLCDSVPK